MTSSLAIAGPWSPINKLMTGPTANIRIALAGDGEKLPVIAGGMQGQLQDAEGVIVGRLDIGRRVTKRGVVGTASADHELADATGIVPRAIGVELDIALVVVVMAGEDD